MVPMEEPVRGGMVVENVYHPVCPYQCSVVSPFSLHCWAEPGLMAGPFRCKGWWYGILVEDHLEPVIDA
jgi:hypothetical protein